MLALFLQVCAGRAEASVKALPTRCGESIDSPDLPSPRYHLRCRLTAGAHSACVPNMEDILSHCKRVRESYHVYVYFKYLYLCVFKYLNLYFIVMCIYIMVFL